MKEGPKNRVIMKGNVKKQNERRCQRQPERYEYKMTK